MDRIGGIDVDGHGSCYILRHLQHLDLRQTREVAFELVRCDPLKLHLSANVHLASEITFEQRTKPVFVLFFERLFKLKLVGADH